MPKVVLSTDGETWVGKELYKGEMYISFDEIRHEFDNKHVTLEPDQDEIVEDIKTILKIEISKDSPVFAKVAKLLCNAPLTKQLVYFSNWQAKYGISKYTGPAIHFQTNS